jgi:hypothetical protein
METWDQEVARNRTLDQKALAKRLRERQARRAQYFASFGDKRIARRVLAGTSGNWHKRHNGEQVYFCDTWPAGWRDLGDVHAIRDSGFVSIRHNGWYADDMQSALIIGRVLQLPAARDGSPRYVPATHSSEWDGVTLYLNDVCDNLRDAVFRADRCAEIQAEESRDDNAKFQAEQRIESLREDISTARKACLTLLREMRPFRKTSNLVVDGAVYPNDPDGPLFEGDGEFPPFAIFNVSEQNHLPERYATRDEAQIALARMQSPTICNVLRARVADYCEEIKEARARIAALTDNYWLAVGE